MLSAGRLTRIASRYAKLRIAVVGDFCLDRYLEIDPLKSETSIETGLPVHNVIRVRAQPGGAGTVLNNLVALGVGTIFPVGFCGIDGEGFELQHALRVLPSVKLDHFLATPLRRTFCYCKPLVVKPPEPPCELERLDSKNWTPTPPPVVRTLLKSLGALRKKVDAVIVMDQVTEQGTGVVTSEVRDALATFPSGTLVMADSRRGLEEYPPVVFKMNAAELCRMAGLDTNPAATRLRAAARKISRRNERPVIVTLSERGILGAQPDGSILHVPALPMRGPIDIVGAGDAVTANTAAALAAGATLREALELAMLASSIVIHQLGTTGTASIAQLRETLNRAGGPSRCSSDRLRKAPFVRRR